MGSNTIPTATSNKQKLRVLLIPILATSHIGPFTELAISLAAAASEDANVEATMAVTPANVSIVQSMLCQRGHNGAAGKVKVATYPFPAVDGLPEGVENFGTAATPEQSMRVMVATKSEALTRPVHETLIRAESPDAVVTDMTFLWNSGIAAELGVPCVVFSVMGAFSMLAMHHLEDVAVDRDDDDEEEEQAVVEVPGFPGPPIRIPRTELPGFLRRPDYSISNLFLSLKAADCFGFAMNTSSELEKQYCELMSTGKGEGGGRYVNRAYFIGPLALPLSSSSSSSSSSSLSEDDDGIVMDWLDSKPSRSVVYVSFGSMAHLKDAQLDELALGLESSGISFLWVVRGNEEWSPPEGWEERVQVQDTGFIIRSWAPQKRILGHHAVGAFVTQCGWNSVLETVAAAVPMLTWPLAFEQFITERLVTDVLGIGERLWPADGPGLRSESYQEHEVIPCHDVARALVEFMRPGGAGDMARTKVMDLALKLHAAVAPGGSSHRDLHRLLHDLLAHGAAAQARS